MRWWLAALILATACGPVAPARAGAVPSPRSCGFPATFQGRPVLLAEPAGAEPRSVVFVLHGINGTASGIRGYSGLDALARHGALVVYPTADHGEWNQAPAVIGSIPDDVGYLEALAAALQVAGCVQIRRAFATGLSNGAGMAYRLACSSALPVVAIATISGDYLGSDDCRLSHPVAALAMHGTADTTVPLGGVTYGTSVHPAVERWAAGWAALDGCTARSGLHWTGCRGSVDVRLIEIAGGKHEWFRSPSATVSVQAYFERYGLAAP